MKKFKNTLCLVATFEPPIGGVTIYNGRLLSHLIENRFNVYSLDLRKSSKLKILKNIFRFRIFYISMSNIIGMILLLLILKTLNKIIIISIHQQFPLNHSVSEKIFEKFLNFSHTCIVENNESYIHLKKLKNNVVLNSAFIPPLNSDAVNIEKLNKYFVMLRGKFTRIFCTNAYDYVLDENDNELYGISNLIDIFSGIHKYCLIIADPSCNYFKNIKEKMIIPQNVLFLHEVDSFMDILINSDCFIRATNTDGDSISIREALFLGIPTIATDIVTRPSDCILFKYGEWKELKNIIKNLKLDKKKINKLKNVNSNAMDVLLNIFNELKIYQDK